MSKDVHHLFKESLGALCVKLTQYLSKWLETYILSSGIKKRKGEIKKGREKRKEKQNDRGMTMVPQYSGAHKQWEMRRT